jgi:hypothetical protein
VFVDNYGLLEMQRVFREKGWKVLTKSNTKHYNFKTVIRISGKLLSKLETHKVINHFEKTQCITQKSGLTQSAQFLIIKKGINTLEFFPRSYYINDITEMMDFIEDFKYS